MTSRKLLSSQTSMFSFVLIIGSLFLSGTESKGCAPPAQSFNFSLLPLDTDVDQVQEVMFLGVVGPFEEKRVCKIKCVDGRWIGPLCSLEQDSTKFQSMSRPCTIHNVPKNSVISYKGRKITPSPELEFAHGSTVSCRCLEPGHYKLLGDTQLICRNSKWSGTFPVCLTTNVFSNFSDDLPPALEWTVAGGGGAVDDEGVIVLLPGSILHLDCLYPRLHGNPTWKWTNTYRQYPTGWAISRAERELRYRLSLYYAKPRDSGTYTCTSPRGYTNSFEVAVQDVSCPSFEVSEGIVMMEGRGSSLGDVVSFSCPTGYYLVGSNTSTCLPSGSWSSQAPKCEVVRCPLISSPDLRLIVDALNTSYTGLAVFSCLLGFRLRGPKYIECTSNGTWSKPPPVCDEIHCPEPEAPWQGSIQVDRASPRAFVVGDSITYTCKSSFVLKGRSLAFCTPEGKWSHPQPKCMESCAHPGSPVHGRVSPRRQRYEIGAVALVTCRPGYRPAGPDRLTCLPSVRLWSSPVPVCVPALGR